MTRKKTYYANFSCNNGTTLIEPLTDTNKQRIEKDIKSWVKAECFYGNKYHWWVEDEDGEIIKERRGRR